jgi:RNA polymerase sigma-70 factor (ECF subfamily)
LNKTRGIRFASELDVEGMADQDFCLQASVETVEAASILREALNILDEADQEIFYRFYYWRQTTLIISTDLGINESTVRSRLARGREKLKSELVRKGFLL